MSSPSAQVCGVDRRRPCLLLQPHDAAVRVGEARGPGAPRGPRQDHRRPAPQAQARGLGRYGSGKRVRLPAARGGGVQGARLAVPGFSNSVCLCTPCAEASAPPRGLLGLRVTPGPVVRSGKAIKTSFPAPSWRAANGCSPCLVGPPLRHRTPPPPAVVRQLCIEPCAVDLKGSWHSGVTRARRGTGRGQGGSCLGRGPRRTLFPRLREERSVSSERILSS